MVVHEDCGKVFTNKNHTVSHIRKHEGAGHSARLQTRHSEGKTDLYSFCLQSITRNDSSDMSAVATYEFPQTIQKITMREKTNGEWRYSVELLSIT